MEYSAFGKVFLGFIVKEDDFIKVHEAQAATCAEGHRQKGREAFCPKDGHKFERRKIKTATPALRAIQAFFEYIYEKEASAEEKFQDMRADGAPITSLENFRWSSAGACETLLVAGVKLSDVDYTKGSLGTIDLDKFQRKLKRVEDLRKALKMEDRPIKLFHQVSLS